MMFWTIISNYPIPLKKIRDRKTMTRNHGQSSKNSIYSAFAVWRRMETIATCLTATTSQLEDQKYKHHTETSVIQLSQCLI